MGDIYNRQSLAEERRPTLIKTAFGHLIMKTSVCTFLIIASMVVDVAAQRNASYHEITGRIPEVDTTHIVVETGKKRLDLERAGWAKCNQESSIGDTVTVHYMLTHARNAPYTLQKPSTLRLRLALTNTEQPIQTKQG